MTDQHPAVTFLLAAHEQAVSAARPADQGRWVADGGNVYVGHPTNAVVDWAYGENAEHIALHDPYSALLRITAEREILAGHASDCGDCKTCDTDAGDFSERGYQWRDAQPWPCRTVLLLARAWGWEEQS